jgi:hypothetical protein
LDEIIAEEVNVNASKKKAEDDRKAKKKEETALA